MRTMNIFTWFIGLVIFAFIALTIKYFYISLPAILVIRWLTTNSKDNFKTSRK